MGEAAVSIPATPPPITRPSLPAKETLRPPVRCRLPPPTSVGRNEPDKESISKRPCKLKRSLSRLIVACNIETRSKPEGLIHPSKATYQFVHFMLTIFLIFPFLKMPGSQLHISKKL